MAQRKQLATIERISDCSTGMYRMGEIDDLPEWVTEYVRQYGEFGFRQVCEYAAGMMERAMQARRDYYKENDQSKECAQAGS
jgi:hypothetical protein